ncbi:hypothetical protein BB558_003941 [Smittium angustum]|uniref:Uncharacterized protein n=1 Tax=Smittium angustum TaxID=133377 RepID=A0A2U1J4X9_SMIAN|nr:hypothetical protein BB558_003941 [Smittium angustum]
MTLELPPQTSNQSETTLSQQISFNSLNITPPLYKQHAPLNNPNQYLNPNKEHVHSICPLKPFSHMIISYKRNLQYQSPNRTPLQDQTFTNNASDQTPNANSPIDNSSPFSKLNLKSLIEAKVEHLSDGLERKLSHLNKNNSLIGKNVGSFIKFEKPKLDPNNNSWSVWNWLGSPKDPEPKCKNSQIDHNHQLCPACCAFSIQEGELAGLVRLGQITDSQGKQMVIVLCAHGFSNKTAQEWWNWKKRKLESKKAKNNFHTRSNNSSTSSLKIHSNRDKSHEYGLCVVHVAEVTILHRVSCLGLEKILPVPISSVWGSTNETRRTYSFSEHSQSDWNLSAINKCDLNTQKQWMSFLVSRHSIIEMAHPLSPSEVCINHDSDPSSMTSEIVGLSGMLGEPLLSYIHPEDSHRVIKALEIAWDVRPDIYHYYENIYYKQGQSKIIEKVISERKNKEKEWRKDGIEVHNAIVELTIQWRVIPPGKVLDSSVDEASWRPFGWDDPNQLEKNCRFVKMKLCRWPAIITPPKPNFHRFSRFYDDPYQETANRLGAHTDSHADENGFVLVALKFIAERAYTEYLDQNLSKSTKINDQINSIPVSGSSSAHSGLYEDDRLAFDLDRLERSLSSLSLANARLEQSADAEGLRIVPGELVEEEYASDGSGALNIFSPDSSSFTSPVGSNSNNGNNLPIDFLCENNYYYKLPKRKTDTKLSIESILLTSPEMDTSLNGHSNGRRSSMAFLPPEDKPKLYNTLGNLSEHFELENDKSVGHNKTESLNEPLSEKNILDSPIPDIILSEFDKPKSVVLSNRPKSTILDIDCHDYYPLLDSDDTTHNASDSNLNLTRNNTKNIYCGCSMNASSETINSKEYSKNCKHMVQTSTPGGLKSELLTRALQRSKSRNIPPPHGFYPRQKRLGPVRSSTYVQAQLSALNKPRKSKQED